MHMEIYQHFLDFIEENGLFSKDDRILLGVSGGVDSVVMLHLFLKAGYSIGIAHCNFQLRGEEADNEQQFVRSLADQNGIVFHTKNFDTNDFAAENRISVQMAARKLRYQWFEELREEHHYDVVAMGHNKNDLVETFFINLLRGTGIKGITGIKSRQNHVVRPLLFASREEIMTFSKEFDIDYMEDSSNLTVKYSRNKIRHQIIPEFEKINPNILETIQENVERFQDAYTIYKRAVEGKKNELTHREGSDLYINIDKLKVLEESKTFLFEILKSYHFTKDIVKEINENLDKSPGKEFFSSTHKLIRDRDYLIVANKDLSDQRRYYIDKLVDALHVPIRLDFKMVDNVSEYRIPRNPFIACIDYDKIEFPLILRKWHYGDYFRPFGFDHYKKLSDFFVDRKYSILDKERVWILATGETIIWIVGERLDDRFRVDKKTSRILEITYFAESAD
jgi:tRNA(Ile)-lysidine synthase